MKKMIFINGLFRTSVTVYQEAIVAPEDSLAEDCLRWQILLTLDFEVSSSIPVIHVFQFGFSLLVCLET